MLTRTHDSLMFLFLFWAWPDNLGEVWLGKLRKMADAIMIMIRVFDPLVLVWTTLRQVPCSFRGHDARDTPRQSVFRSLADINLHRAQAVVNTRQHVSMLPNTLPSGERLDPNSKPKSRIHYQISVSRRRTLVRIQSWQVICFPPRVDLRYCHFQVPQH